MNKKLNTNYFLIKIKNTKMNLSSTFDSVIANSKQRPFQKTRDENPTLTNIGKKWSKSEETDLLNRISKGESIQEIATEFKRTTGGIRGRLIDIACAMVLSGKSMEEAIQTTSIDKARIQECLPYRKNKEDRKKSKTPEQAQIQTEPKQQSEQNSDIKELLFLTRDIHSMMKEFLAQKNPPAAVKKLLTIKTISKPRCLINDD
jgi:uncharacterized protein (DUF433 family)